MMEKRKNMKHLFLHHKKLTLSLLAIGAMLLAVTAQEYSRQWTTVESSDLVTVGLACQTTEPDQAEIEALVDEAIESVLGADGLEALVSPGDKVVIKVNIVEPTYGLDTEKGRGIITDPRVTRYVAEQVRSIIGTGGTADIKVVDACFSTDPDPSAVHDTLHGFRYAYYEQTGNTTKDPGDVSYDYDLDGILDGTSNATLVNLDAIDVADRYSTWVTEPDLGSIEIRLPKFLRTKEQAIAAGEPDEYCDVHINLNTFKTHRLAGLTCTMKNYYGYAVPDLTWSNITNTRGWHGGSGMGGTVPYQTTTDPHLMDQYICAHHKARPFDLTIIEAITANRRGPTDPHFSHNRKVHYILSNSILAATDSVAMDTVCALFAGLDPDSIEFLAQGQQDGLGTCDPSRIRVSGLDKLTQHRDWMMATYGSLEELEFFAQTGEYQYPFPDGVGDTYKMADFDEPENVTLSNATLDTGTTYTFTVNATESKGTDTGVVRVELLVDGELVGYETQGLGSMPVTLAVDMSDYATGSHTCQAAVWDETLNCSVSNTVTFAPGATSINTPLAPTVSNPTQNSLDVAIASGDGNPSDTEYALHVDPAIGGDHWLKTDGTAAASEVWATTTAWNTVTASGLTDATQYRFAVKARQNGGGSETALGPESAGVTAWSGGEIAAGNLRFHYANGEVRRVMVGDKEIASRIYLGVRDSAWDTVMPTFSTEDVWIEGDYSTITLEARCTNPNADYAWTGTIVTIPNEITFEVHGEAMSNFSTPRIGLNIFWGAESLKGQAYELDLVGGGTKNSAFPVPVAYDDNGAYAASVLENGDTFSTLRYTVGGMTVEGGLDASATFGLEDQRTYGDSSYKSYAGFESGNITTGETGWQRVKLRVTGGDSAQTPWNASIGTEITNTQVPAFVTPSTLTEKPWEQFIRYKWGTDPTNAQMPFNPAAHLFDSEIYMDNVPAILDQVQTIRDDFTGTINNFRIDPIQIDPPYPNHTTPDPRHQDIFSAAWSVRVVKYLALGNVDQAGFEAGAGYYGETVRDALSPYAGQPILATGVPPHGAYEVLAVLDDGQPVAWVANTTEEAQSATLEGLDAFGWATADVRRLNGSMAATADFSAATPHAISGGALSLTLAPYEVVWVTEGDPAGPAPQPAGAEPEWLLFE